ncbi:Gamma-crystallin-related [Trinorchestia longiramus]|nr:Gamma-crystallin-related [Trinorchestia longiramus]
MQWLLNYLTLALLASSVTTSGDNSDSEKPLRGYFNPTRGRQCHIRSRRAPNVSVILDSYNFNLDFRLRYSDVWQTGLWLYYSSDLYRGEDVSAVIATGFNYSLPHSLSSVRYAGSSRSLHVPSIHLYAMPWFRGEECQVEVPPWHRSGRLTPSIVPNFRDCTPTPLSVIITGGEWAVFELPNLFGACRCLTPSFFNYLTDYSEATFGVYEAGLFPYLNLTGLEGVGSAVAGCAAPFDRICSKSSWEPVTAEQAKKKCSVVSNRWPNVCP